MGAMRGKKPATALASALAIAACGQSSDGESKRKATWYGGIQPLLVENCSMCHTDGGLGPFPLDEYETASEVAPAALLAVESNIMPPWLAHDTDECQPPLPWKDDMRLTEAEKQLLRDWVEDGTPLGNPKKALPVPEPPDLGLRDPSVTMEFEQPYTVEEGADVFECFVLDPGVEEDVWLTGVQFNADNAKIDHHALVFLDPEREAEGLATDGHFPCFGAPTASGPLVGAWAPGALPFEPPPQSGVPMPGGSLLVVQMHYHPTRGTETDRSSVSIRYTTEEPEYEAAIALLGNFDEYDAELDAGLMPQGDEGDQAEFVIPARAEDHVETMVYRHELPIETPVFAVGAHMHYVGVDMKISHRMTNGSEECFLQTPRWDFEWQRAYVYDAPIEELPTVGPADELVMRCTYNNTLDNPAVAEALIQQDLTAPTDVYLGDETLDEMCLGVFGVLLPPGLL